ncbi:hypothetical protein HPB48_008802 [Haemaphysalis longicornis]|uniref:Acidic fibroblast growth factor intracellular-binding protein n=1 Tax=Haemaphysalis longicornis TaxID=44386 RepID=A0A9J6H076_HAELO|nr:hypothetical protein HPB48_008802 [Haemaphysalis longicornis]
MKEPDVPLELLKSDVLDHYRTLLMLERLLHSPVHLAEQWTFQLAPQTQRMLIAKYYDFDASVVREFLGKKLSSRNRKDLDEVSEKTGVDIKSCRRQVGQSLLYTRNVISIRCPKPSLIWQVHDHHHLTIEFSPEIRKYAALVYTTHNRFETGKKKLLYLRLEDFVFCVDQMISSWSCRNPNCKYEESGMEMDREFLQQLREMKLLLDKDHHDRLKDAVLFSLRTQISKHTLQDSLTRTLVNIAYGLNHSKDLRDFFIDVVEKYHHHYEEHNCTRRISRHNFLPNSLKEKLAQFFPYIASDVLILSPFNNLDPHLHEVWTRYSETMAKCVCKLYPA